MNTKNICETFDRLGEAFSDYAAKDLNFKALISDLISLGVIHSVIENDSVK